MKLLFLALLVAISIVSIAFSQTQSPDITIMSTLLGNCTYREAVYLGQLQQMQKQASDTADYWSHWIGEGVKK